MVLQYSNQETSVTIGESVRDEDGKSRFQEGSGFLPCAFSCSPLYALLSLTEIIFQFSSYNQLGQTTSTMASWSYSS